MYYRIHTFLVIFLSMPKAAAKTPAKKTTTKTPVAKAKTSSKTKEVKVSVEKEASSKVLKSDEVLF